MRYRIYSVVNADELSRSEKNNQFRNQQLYSHEKTTRINSALLIAISDFSSGHPGVHAILKNITENHYSLFTCPPTLIKRLQRANGTRPNLYANSKNYKCCDLSIRVMWVRR